MLRHLFPKWHARRLERRADELARAIARRQMVIASREGSRALMNDYIRNGPRDHATVAP